MDQSSGLSIQPKVEPNVEIWMEAKAENGRSYYYSAVTRATTWKRPIEVPGQLVVKELAKPPALPLQSDVTMQVPPQRMMSQLIPQVEQAPATMSLPPSAVTPRFTSLASTAVFAGLPPVRSAKQPCWANQPRPVASNVEIWMEARADDGSSYYYSIDTRATSWQRPTEIPGRLVVKDLANPPTLPLQQEAPKPDEAAGDGHDHSTEPPTAYNQKCRPVEYKTIEGSQWCVVWSNDGQVFFYNPSMKTSVWERPPELHKRTDVDQLVRTVPKKVQKAKKRLNAKQRAVSSEEKSTEQPTEPKRLKTVKTDADEERLRKELEMRAELKAYREQREREREERERRRLIEQEEERQARERRRRERQEREEQREHRRRKHAVKEPGVKEEDSTR